MKVKVIDPPSGWKYGFPKMIPNYVTDVKDWLIKNGYPQSEIDAFGEYFVCQYFEREIPSPEDIAREEFQNVGDEGLFPNYTDKDIWIDGFVAGYEYAKKQPK